jgi:hypothetical protein
MALVTQENPAPVAVGVGVAVGVAVSVGVAVADGDGDGDGDGPGTAAAHDTGYAPDGQDGGPETCTRLSVLVDVTHA